MYSSGKTHEKPTLASPLPEIANWLAQMYFFRKYPAPVSKGLLDYSEIRKKTCEGINGKFYRQVHGFQNAARCAGLIPVLFALYKKYQGCLKGKIAEELASVDADWIKKLQIVALMRSAGRWNDLGSGSEFSAQGKRECCHILKELGLGGAEADRWSNVLIATENEKKTEFLGSSLLADATTMETVRDFSLNKNIKISMLPFYLHLDQKVSRQEAILEFTALCCHHAGVIKSQQGTLYLALLDANGSPLKDWPALDKDHSLHAKQVQAIQKVFEYDEKCFEKCQQAVNFRGLANNLEMLFKKEPAWHQQPQSQGKSRAEEAEALARAKAKAEAREAEALARSRTEKKESPKNAEDKLAEIMAKIRADKDLRSSPEVIEKADRQAKAEADPFYRVQAYEKNVIESYRKSNRGLAEVTLGLKKNQYTVPDDIPALESMAKELQEMEGMILQGKFNGDYILKKHGFFTVQLHGIFDRVDLRKQALNPTPGKTG